MFKARAIVTEGRARAGTIAGLLRVSTLLRGCASLAAALASVASASADDWLLPRVSAHAEAARYAPAERELGWTTWIGAAAGLVRARGMTLGGSAEVETIIGNERRAFDANQANYHLEVGVSARAGGFELTPFFHHVSRHVVDRPKGQAVDWNVLGLRVARQVEGSVPLRLTLGAGHTTLASFVGYGWELTARAEGEWPRQRRAAGYAIAAARAVTVTAKRAPELPPGGFVDLLVEAGGRFRRQARALSLFAAFERRHDVFVDRPGQRDRALIGFRVSFAESE
jgi:hypothetical protein